METLEPMNTPFQRLNVKNEIYSVDVVRSHKLTESDLSRVLEFKKKIQNRSKLEGVTLSHVRKLLETYLEYTRTIDEMNNDILRKNKYSKMCRRPNPPSEVTEHMALFAWHSKFGTYPVWAIKGGDLKLCDMKTPKHRCLTQIEVKAFTSDGPISYGPKEKWNVIMYVDLRDLIKNQTLKVYLVNETNTSKLFRNLPVKKPTDTEKGTFGEQRERGRRPRLCFDKTKEYFRERMICIFSGHLEELLPPAPKST